MRRARPLASVARAGQGAALGSLRQPSAEPGEAKGRQRAAVGRLGPARPGGRGRGRAPHFACGAGAPPEVPGGTTFGSPVLGAGFSMVEIHTQLRMG